MNRLFLALASCLLSALLMLSIPLLNMALDGRARESRAVRPVAQVELRSVNPERPKPPPRPPRRPSRPKPMQARPSAGPRFAMDLEVAGAGGAAAPPLLANLPGKARGEEEGVDVLPEAETPPSLSVPAQVQAAERDAYLVLSFCVDASGRPYDVQVVEERPSGLGMARAGREALARTRFAPARKDGSPVAFCGLEQPFEVRFGR